MASSRAILQDVRVLDFSWVLAGPFTTRILADYGAEVIKIQPLLPESDDIFSRGYYNTWNRNKLGISLNLSKPEGLEIARKLVNISDVVVENFSPRVMENWGLDYPELKKINLKIIMLSMSVMGHHGPWRDYAGFGPTVQSFSGFTYLTSYPGQPPLGLGYSFSDHAAGLFASLAVLTALEQRSQSGEGQYIDLSQTESMVSLLGESVTEYTLKGQEAKPSGNSSSQAAPHGIYPCRGEDRWCAITVFNDAEWEGLKRAAGNPDWMLEERFTTLTARLQNVRALDNYMRVWTGRFSAEEVMARLQAEGVPAGVVQNAADLAADPQLQSRGLFNSLDQASPLHLSIARLNTGEWPRHAGRTMTTSIVSF